METLQDIIESIKGYESKTAQTWKEGDDLKIMTFEELHDQIQNYSRAFLEFGLEKGDKVSVIAENVPEWIGLDLGIANAGLVDAPRGSEETPEVLNHIIGHSDAKVLIVENSAALGKIDFKKYGSLPLYTINKIAGMKHISELEELGKNSSKELPKVSKDDVAGFIYTSGTTAMPKGVMLSHGNFTSNVEAIEKRVPLNEDDKFLSMLPPWHSFERIVKYIACAEGLTTVVSNKARVLEDLAEFRPTIMASVPKIWERVYAGLMAKLEDEKAFKRNIAKYAIKQSTKYCTRKHKWMPAPWKMLWHNIATKAVYSKLHEKFGEQFRFAVSGGGALPDHVDEFFHAAAVEILEGYGMTETAPIIATRTLGKGELHTVGKLIDGVEAKLIHPDTGKELPMDQEGVVHVKGPNVMLGYYKDEEETNKTIKDGWLDTGDLGYFDEEGRLKLTGRAKEIIVLSNGENIAPVPIESAMKQSQYIEDVVLLGQDWNALGALVAPEHETLEKYCADKGIEKRLDSPGVRELFKEEIKKYVDRKTGFREFHYIRDFELLPEPFVVGEDMTPTLKPMRRKINKNYETQINSVYDSIHK